MSDDAERLQELEQELLDAYEQLDERDRELEDLRDGVGGSGGGRDDAREDDDKIAEERDRLISDLEKYREELMESKDLIADLQANAGESKITNETLASDKKALTEQVSWTSHMFQLYHQFSESLTILSPTSPTHPPTHPPRTNPKRNFSTSKRTTHR